MTSTVLNIADYQPQLDEKAARIQDLLSDFETPELERSEERRVGKECRL